MGRSQLNEVCVVGGTIHYSLKLTINLGNYQSASPQIGITLPIVEGEIEDDVYKRAQQFVEERMETERARWGQQKAGDAR